MELSYWASSSQPWDDIVSSCRLAEANGWCGIWVPDHFMSEPSGEDDPKSELSPVLEAWTLQAALAALIPRVRIGAMVSGNTYRHPAVLANMATTVDHISGGRSVLGLGAGWQVNEHEHYGIELGSPGRRSDRLEEACAIITSLLRNERTTFQGEHYKVIDAPAEPKPLADRLPLLVAGRGEQRTLRTVARFADEWNAWALPDEIAGKREVIERWCTESDRDSAEIRITIASLVVRCGDEDEAAAVRSALGHRGGLVGTVDQIASALASYAAAGVDEVVVPDFNIAAAERDEFVAMMSELAAPFRP
ncbi:MAG: TIGR03560 family F420-dependent LLM class oxidoreductase [Acidobacteria bacterium]|nr:TIGR03560 family F420-dependent LLM class oxidoreductase [Acidobacteriota bacterium]